MSRERLLTGIDENLLCGICHKRMQQPKILSACFHSFCQGCLEEILARKSIGTRQLKCPKCRKVTRIPNGRAADLETRCTSLIVPEIVISEALECEQGDSEPVCGQHHSALNQYCSTCNELLCSECIHSSKHLDHVHSKDVQPVRNILPESVEYLSNLLDPANKQVSQLEQLMEEIETRKQELSSNRQQAIDEIDSFFKEMEECLDERRKALVSVMEKDVTRRMSVLEEYSQQLTQVRKSSLHTFDSMEKLCMTQSVYVLTEGEALEQNLQQTEQSFKHIGEQLQDPHLALVIRFQGDQLLRRRIYSSGTLIMCESGADSSSLVARYQPRVIMTGKALASHVTDNPEDEDDQYVPMKSVQFGLCSIPSENVAPKIHLSPTVRTQYADPNLSPRDLQHSPTYFAHFIFDDIPDMHDGTGDHKTTGDDAGYVNKQPQFQMLAPELFDLKQAKRLLDAGSCSGSDSGSEGNHYDTIPRLDGGYSTSEVGSEEEEQLELIPPPPLPLDTLYRSLRRQADSLDYDGIVSPEDRAEPEVIQPVKVINSDQLREPDSIDQVFPAGICINSADVITITDLRNHCLRQVDRDGVFIQTFGQQGKSIWHFNCPTGVALNTDHLYVVNHANGLCQKLTQDGEYVLAFGRKHLRTPRAIAVSRNVYISDTEKQRVYIYQSDGTYLRPIGKHERNIHFERPTGIAFDTAGNILVADRGQVPCIWHISQEGKLLGKIGEGHLLYPSEITVADNGSIFVSERGKANCISVFTLEGELTRCFGRTGSKPGEFNGPSGVAINSQGQIIVADQHNQRLQIFDLGGEVKSSENEQNQNAPNDI